LAQLGADAVWLSFSTLSGSSLFERPFYEQLALGETSQLWPLHASGALESAPIDHSGCSKFISHGVLHRSASIGE
jgi:hypothetical protein